MASSNFTLSPAIDLPLSIKSSATSSQSVPLFPFRHIDSFSFRYKSKRNATVSASASRSNAVSEQAIESIATGTTQDSQTTLAQPSSSKLVLVVGGTGGVGNSPLLWYFCFFRAFHFPLTCIYFVYVYIYALCVCVLGDWYLLAWMDFPGTRSSAVILDS